MVGLVALWVTLWTGYVQLITAMLGGLVAADRLNAREFQGVHVRFSSGMLDP